MRGAGETVGRRYPAGAEVMPGGGVHFRVWASDWSRVAVVLEDDPAPGRAYPLTPDRDGYFAGVVAPARVGCRYRYRLGDGDLEDLPDPASRFQPEGPHGPSQVVDPGLFDWTDQKWPGITSAEGQVLYEIHVGTFTQEGTWTAAARELPYLAELGITALEIMPVNEFSGEFGWGYDGVDLFAPFHGYGSPDDFRRFVDAAHGRGIGILLDVVYNHLGPEGNVVQRFSKHYFSKTHESEWGDTLNFDGPERSAVRAFVLANVAYWIDEFHLDGLRIDATQGLYDTSPVHILAEIAQTLRQAGGARKVLVVGESEPQRGNLLRGTERIGLGFDMSWSEDFHHSATVAATGYREGYLEDYVGSPQELISALKRGWLYQGQWNLRQNKRRGSPALDLAPTAFINYLQNHDQVANTALGRRLAERTTPGRFRALTAMLLLGPGTPLLFQGQEFAASSPFHYFSDASPEISKRLRQGRCEFLKQFASLASAEMQAAVPAPDDRRVFDQSKLHQAERATGAHGEVLALHRDLLRLRREDATLRAGQRRGGIDGAVLGPEALVVRWFDPAGADDRLLLVNLGAELPLRVVAEPLLAPPEEGRRWRVLWSSENLHYGGIGVVEPESEQANWRLPAHAALLMAPAPCLADEARNKPGTI